MGAVIKRKKEEMKKEEKAVHERHIRLAHGERELIPPGQPLISCISCKIKGKSVRAMKRHGKVMQPKSSDWHK